MAPFVLIVEDEEAIAWALRTACERLGCRVVVCPEAESALKHAQRSAPALILLDVRLPGMDGLTALGKFKAIAPQAAVVVMTAHGNLTTAVQAVAGGATDYLAKPFDLEQALVLVRRATAEPPPPKIVPPPAHGEAILGVSSSMQQVFKKIALVTATDVSVLIVGEPGTGKELVARAIHANSPRRTMPFVTVRFAGLTADEIEAELFGRGGQPARAGSFEPAAGGTLFLEEVGDLPLPVQGKLLNALERKEVVPGGGKAVPINVRIIAATRVSLSKAVTAGTFRHDLYFRLNVFPITLPGLNERLDDLPLLARRFLADVQPQPSSLPAETIAFLKRRPWPGHIRELRSILQHAALTARGGPLLPEHFPPPIVLPGTITAHDQLAEAVRVCVREAFAASLPNEPNDLHDTLVGRVESALIDEVMRQVGGNRLAAGRAVGLARATVRKLLRRGATTDDGDA